MSATPLRERIAQRLAAAGAECRPEIVDTLARYLELLARWNRTINLTAFALDPPADRAIDRLIVEPVQAAAFVRKADRVAVDIGSGGGSPALPLVAASPHLAMTLVESRARKAAFLREAVRALELRNVEVETVRLDARGLPRLNGRVDLVTMRAVRADETIWNAARALIAPDGRFFWFATADSAAPRPTGWSVVSRAPDGAPFLTVLAPAE